MFIQFLKGKLPWQKLSKRVPKEEKTRQLKLSTSVKDLCEVNNDSNLNYVNYGFRKHISNKMCAIKFQYYNDHLIIIRAVL
jgi:hypothetical protein